MADLNVKTPKGLKCPKERNYREYVTDDEKGTPVPDTAYYRRLIDEGSLLRVPEPAEAPDLPGGKTSKGGAQ